MLRDAELACGHLHRVDREDLIDLIEEVQANREKVTEIKELLG